MAEKEYIFGVADISIGDDIKFDGKDLLQAEGGSISLAPTYTEFTFEDFGETIVERRLSGWEGSVTVVAGEEDVRLMNLALASTVASGEGITDAKIGTKLEGKQVRIHPRHLDATNTTMDWVLFNCASIGGFERDYAQEQGSFTIELTMMPKKGFDASADGNFFQRGGDIADPETASYKLPEVEQEDDSEETE